MIRTLTGIGRTRWLTHFALLLITLGAVYLTRRFYAPNAALSYILTIATGYLSLGLLIITLLVGPLKLMWQRRNPVNVDLRRDVGIWTAINGLIHVVFGLQVRERLGVIGYFLRETANGYVLLTNRFGIANWVGLAATVILIVLLATSNDWSLRKLRGPRWKAVQRWNYGLAGLALLHTFLYQMVSGREHYLITATLAFTLVLLAGQFVGIQLYRAGRRRRKR